MVQQREGRMVNEYLKEVWPDTIQWKRVRLGPARDVEEAKMYQVLMRWADAILWTGEEIIIIEAKIRPNAGAIGQLEHYLELFGKTPEFRRYWDRPRRGVILVGLPDVDLAGHAASKGLEFVVFRKPWIEAYITERAKK